MPDSSSPPLDVAADGPLSPDARTDRTAAGTTTWFVLLRRALLRRTGLAAACLLAFALGSARLGDEGYVSLQGDMPRYLMNGVYLHDLAVDQPFGSLDQLMEYTRLYYARYPALSIGHHPLLLPLLEAPAYALFGVSVASARLVTLGCFVAAVAFFYLFVELLYGWPAALAAASLLASSPAVVMSGQSVLSEAPTLACLMAAAYALERFCRTGHRRALAAFAAAAVLSVYAKQPAALLFPAFAAHAATRLGVRRLVRRDVLVAVTSIVLLSAPIVPITLMLSHANVQMVAYNLGRGSLRLWPIVTEALSAQLSRVVLLLAAAGLVRMVVRRDRTLLLLGLWMGAVLGGLLLTGRADPARYSLYWVPAFCAAAASLIAGTERGVAQRLAAIALAVATALQIAEGRSAALQSADGYEAAARYVLAHDPGPTVLFSGTVDTGFFTFFVRKHDPARRLVVLRSDKIFTTAYLAQESVEERIERPEQIDALLHAFGVKFVVLEDRPFASRALEWLRAKLHSPQFIERVRIPIGTSDRRLKDVSLAVYEFTEATPPAVDAVLSIHLPLAQRNVDARLQDLIDRKYLK